MILDLLRQTLFVRKFVDDVRSIEENSLFAFEVPSALLGGRASTATSTICALLPPDFRFYYQIVAIVLFQNIFNAILGVLMFKIVVEPRQQRTAMQTEKESSSNSDSGDRQDAASDTLAFLFALGIAMPCVVLEPVYVIRALEIRNAGLIMLFLATPIVNSLRITEALFGFAPVPTRTSLWNYVVYFSCLFGMEFDLGNPKRASWEFFRKRLATLGRDFAIVSVVVSVLKPCGYEFFETGDIAAAVYSMDHTLQEMVSWRHLLNNFFVAFLLSASLSQETIGVSLLYNIFYGVQTYEVVLNPMLKSKSPSDFWGRRWNVLVHTGLKNGVYKPTRKRTSSKLLAVVATFVVSGIIHEYVNYVLFSGKYNGNGHGITMNDEDASYKITWKQMLFFGWNGILVSLEYCIGHWKIFQWMSRSLPPIVVTALVVCSALPLAHLFTGDWIKHGFFDAVHIGTPIIVCRRE
mmetsp:Transcript_4619/g.9732  ORF Transcript_4619/g.9732 Transcript_4619/m.9732 type:complete len:464 (+) Transcript_4619:49-1440(+)